MSNRTDNGNQINPALLEEYKALRAEIDDNRNDGLRILQTALTMVTLIFTAAYSEILNIGQNNIRWLYLFLPVFILTPLNMLLAQRTRITWIIGRYIQQELDPQLGTHWETLNFFRKTGILLKGYEGFAKKGTLNSSDSGWLKRIGQRLTLRQIIPFVWGTSGSLILLQIGCIVLASTDSSRTITGTKFEGAFPYLLILSILAVVAQFYMTNRANHPEKYAIIPKIDMDDMEKLEL